MIGLIVQNNHCVHRLHMTSRAVNYVIDLLPVSPFGQCPWLEIDEGGEVTTLAQSTALTHYLAKKFGMYELIPL